MGWGKKSETLKKIKRRVFLEKKKKCRDQEKIIKSGGWGKEGF